MGFFRYLCCLIFIIVLPTLEVFPQQAPAKDENISYLVTFGANAESSWGDDDFCQTLFFMVPPSYTDPFYIRVYDPDTGGELDEQKGEFNTTVKISIYGGKDAWNNIDARQVDPIGNYKSGNMLASRSFGTDGSI